MNYPAASSGVSIGIFIIAPRGGGIKPSPASGGFIRLWRVYPPLEDSSAAGGLNFVQGINISFQQITHNTSHRKGCRQPVNRGHSPA